MWEQRFKVSGNQKLGHGYELQEGFLQKASSRWRRPHPPSTEHEIQTRRNTNDLMLHSEEVLVSWMVRRKVW